MIPQGAFLLYIKAHAGLTRHVAARVEQVDTLTPRFKALYRTESAGNAGGMSFSRRIDTGKIDKNVVEMYVKDWGFNIALTAAGVKAKLRRLRPQEAAQLAELDAQYELHRQAMQTLAADRKALLKEAFARAHVVTVTELREAADAKATLQETVNG